MTSAAVLFGVFGAVGAIGTKTILEYSARQEAKILISDVREDVETDDQFIKSLTLKVHNEFVKSLSTTPPISFLMKVRPYLTHRFIPKPFRVRRGTIEMLHFRGQCDSAARILVFALQEAGFKADQFNMVGPFSAHSAVLIETPQGRHMLSDPNFGVLPMAGEKILSAEMAQKQLRDAADPNQMWKLLAPTSSMKFYRSFADTVFAKQGDRLEIVTEVKLEGNELLHLGRFDLSSVDVEAQQANSFVYWHYMGSRYDRSWIRRLRMHQDTRVIIQLTENAKPQLITSDQIPEIIGNKLIYQLTSGQTLSFVDGKAGFDWLHLRSYQDVDLIRFEAL